MSSPGAKPTAVMLFPDWHVPAHHHDRLGELVVPTWRPSGVAGPSAAEAEPGRFSIVVSGVRDLSGRVLAQFPGLRFLLLTVKSSDFADLEYCEQHGITVCNTPRYTSASVAEYAFALLLARARHVCELDSALRSGVEDTGNLIGVELEGKVAGVVGLGDIGSRVARLALAFGMNVVFVNRTKRAVDGLRQVPLDEALRTSDVLFLTLPLTAETRCLLDQEQFSLMKPTSILVNMSAEALVNRDALRLALAEGQIAAAAVDLVGAGEPYAQMPNVTVTPSHGWCTAEELERRAATWLETLEAYLKGAPRNVVCPSTTTAS